MKCIVVLACIGAFFSCIQIEAGGQEALEHLGKEEPTLSGIPADMQRFICKLLIQEQEKNIEKNKEEFDCEDYDTQEEKEIKRYKNNYKALALLADALAPLLMNKRLTALVIKLIAERLQCSEFLVATYLAGKTTYLSSKIYLSLWLKNSISTTSDSDVLAKTINTLDPVYDTNPFFESLKQKNETLIKLLLVHGALLSVENTRKMTPLMVAAHHQEDFFKQRLHVAVDALYCDPHQIVQSYLSKKDYQGRTALYHAVRKNNLTATQELLGSGAEINAKTSTSTTSLHRAASNGNSAIVSLLLQNGAHINAQDFGGKTPLMRAFIEWGTYAEEKKKWDDYTSAIRVLLEDKNIDLLVEDNENKTAVDWAQMLAAINIPIATLLPSLQEKLNLP